MPSHKSWWGLLALRVAAANHAILPPIPRYDGTAGDLAKNSIYTTKTPGLQRPPLLPDCRAACADYGCGFPPLSAPHPSLGRRTASRRGSGTTSGARRAGHPLDTDVPLGALR